MNTNLMNNGSRSYCCGLMQSEPVDTSSESYLTDDSCNTVTWDTRKVWKLSCPPVSYTTGSVKILQREDADSVVFRRVKATTLPSPSDSHGSTLKLGKVALFPTVEQSKPLFTDDGGVLQVGHIRLSTTIDKENNRLILTAEGIGKTKLQRVLTVKLNQPTHPLLFKLSCDARTMTDNGVEHLTFSCGLSQQQLSDLSHSLNQCSPYSTLRFSFN